MGSTVMKMKAGVSAVWGTTEAGTQATGIVKSAGRKRNSEKETIADDVGDTVGQVHFDFKDELTIEVICKSTMTNPTDAGAITIAGLAGVIQDWDIKWEQKGLKMLSINATKFHNVLA